MADRVPRCRRRRGLACGIRPLCGVSPIEMPIPPRSSFGHVRSARHGLTVNQKQRDRQRPAETRKSTSRRSRLQVAEGPDRPRTAETPGPTHNPSVPGSNPGGPIRVGIPALKSLGCVVHACHRRPRCASRAPPGAHPITTTPEPPALHSEDGRANRIDDACGITAPDGSSAVEVDVIDRTQCGTSGQHPLVMAVGHPSRSDVRNVARSGPWRDSLLRQQIRMSICPMRESPSVTADAQTAHVRRTCGSPSMPRA
jgi:hypothetical protein